MTGTPLDNTWLDTYALLSLLRGHPITSLARMRLGFTDGLLVLQYYHTALEVSKVPFSKITIQVTIL